MEQYYLAIDIGASSGRHILGCIRDGKIELEEIYRFENGMKRENGHLYWDSEGLFENIVIGIAKCAEIGKIPASLAIDTWGVDYALLDENDQLIGRTYGYRDHRTDGVDEEVYRLIPERELYERTGIAKQPFNTIYQLTAARLQEPETLEKAAAILLLPDYFNFLLTGNKCSEYTNATTGQLVNAETKEWDYELIERLLLPKKIFRPLSMPGTLVGRLQDSIAQRVGFTCDVVLAATHDTASAVMSVPSQSDDTLYISSGTWSLMGVENAEPVTGVEAQKANFTNEGGYDYRFRFLKNIMGLWMIQQVRHEPNDSYSFAQLCDLAEEAKNFASRVDVNDQCFMSPDNMTEEIKDYCRRTGQQVPGSVGEIAAVIYQSLSESYARTVEQIEALTGKHYDAINIVGGGSKADYLNRLTAAKSGRTVYAGPGEATAIGNLAVQMIRAGELENLLDARRCIFDSFGVETIKA